MFENVARKIKRGVRRDGKCVGNAWPSCSGDASRLMWRGKQPASSQPEPDIVGFSSGELIDVMMIKMKLLPSRSMYPFRLSTPQLSRVRPMPWSKFSRSNDGQWKKKQENLRGGEGERAMNGRTAVSCPDLQTTRFVTP